MKRLLLTFLFLVTLASALSAQGLVRRPIYPSAGGSGTAFVTSITAGTARSNFTGCLGYRFTVGGSPITVDALGRYMISGNSGTHTIRLMSGASTVIASASVNMSGGTPGTFVYTSITPVALSASTDYWIFSEELNGGDEWYDNDAAIASNAAYATPANAYFENTCGVDLDGPYSGSTSAYGLPNFKAY